MLSSSRGGGATLKQFWFPLVCRNKLKRAQKIYIYLKFKSAEKCAGTKRRAVEYFINFTAL